MERNVHNVLISHAPPYKTLDAVGDNHVGSQSIRKHMTGFDLVCRAHIHEARGSPGDGVTIVNPDLHGWIRRSHHSGMSQRDPY